jgi:hypothetical protein
MDTDTETARKVAVRKLANEIKAVKGCDGVIVLEFRHTDETAKIMTYNSVGKVPALDELILAIAMLMATESFTAGKEDAKKEAMESVLNIKPQRLKL